ncbi:MAG: phosphodiester glycosidase family protein [Anaerolineales bacterium]|nr:phosphodiester glycosidase family protein [Anaerolineales bacterium]
MSLQRKGNFNAAMASCTVDDADSIVSKVRDSTLSHIVINIADDHLQTCVRNLRDTGIRIWGWQFILGDNPIEEARFAIRCINENNLDGLVFRVEQQYKQPGKNLAASEYLDELRHRLPEIPLALSSYGLPSYHPQIPWTEFLTDCDFNMPQFCRLDGESLRRQLIRCQSEFLEITPSRPIVPISPLDASTALFSFLIPSQDSEIKGINLWGWDEEITDGLLELWEAIRNHPFQSPAAEKDIVERYFAALNTKDAQRVIDLYAPQSALVTSARTIAGEENMQAWFQGLFTQVLPDVDFILTNYSGSGNSRIFRWTARAEKSIFEPGRVRTSESTSAPLLYSDVIEIFKSVFYKKLVRSSPRKHTAHIISIDLNDPSIDLMVTPASGLGKTASDFLTSYDLQLAVNGDEWLSWTNPKGLAVSEGVKYSAPSAEPTAYISASNQVKVGGEPPPVIWDAISGSHTLVRNGKVNRKLKTCAKPEVYCITLAPRTSLGLTGDNKLILIVAQGTEDSLRDALTLKELATLNLELGVLNAINLDGGGSSTLAVDDYGVPKVVNSPSDGSERVVSNHLGIRAQYLDRESVLKVEDGNDTFGLLEGKIIYHFTSFTVNEAPAFDRTKVT